MPSPYREAHDIYIQHYVATNERRVIGTVREVDGKHKDGSVFPIALSVSEVRSKSRRLFTGIVRDITERKEMEKRLLQAERLSAVGEAMTALTHESRNALQRSQACLEVLKFVIDGNARALDLIDGVQRAQDDLHRLYEDVRQYAAPLRISRSRNDIGMIAREAWTCLSHRYQGRQVSFSDQSDVDLHCEIDEFAIRQVFQNIFDNALAACSDPMTLRVSCTDCNRSRIPTLKISVCDNGPGLSPEARGRIFEPFFTTKTHGTGLGMAICHRIIEAHGGEIRVGNTGGSGAEFVIELPRVANG